MVRAPYYDENGVKKGAWSREEDDKLRAYIQKYGHWNWRQLPKFAGLRRCGKSCRLRWMNYLRPEVRHGNYTAEEENKIMKLHEQLGNKWSLIAARLPGRTDNEIKNYWHSHLKKLTKKTSTVMSEVIRDPYCSGSLQYDEASQARRYCKAQSVRADNSTPHPVVLESSEMSSAASASCLESWSPSSDHCLAENSNVVSSQASDHQDSGGDFWTEPFVADSIYDQETYQSSLAKEMFLSPYGLYCDDTTDLFYQLMGELPDN